MSHRRGDYKRVWTELAATKRLAVQHVQGDVGEDELQGAGKKTVSDLQATVGLNREDTILEIGCGIGRVGSILAPLCKIWIGCDVSPTMLGHARRRLASVDNALLVEISGYDLAPFNDASVDLVYCTVVFMHLAQWDRYNYILEAVRILRPGGRLFVDNVNLCSTDGWDTFEHLRKTYRPEQRPPHISEASTPDEIATYLERAGLTSYTVRTTDQWVQGYGTK